MSNGCIATEVTPQFTQNRKWIGIYPLNEDERGKFKYIEIELPKNIIENDLDWFEDDEIKTTIYLKSIEELYQLLEEKKMDPQAFDVPWKFKYPYHY